MSQVKRIKKKSFIPALILFAGLLFVTSACGSSTPNPKSEFNADSGAHAAGWLPAGHMVAAQADMTTCAQCHGSDYSGGIANVSCTQCHLGGASSVHPTVWGQLTATAHGAYVQNGVYTACANAYCHGTTLSGVANSGPSCTSCHLGGIGAVHPLDWGAFTYIEHAVYVNASGTMACQNADCHGTSLTGVAGGGPSCTSCHIGGATSVHPATWNNNILLHGYYVNSNGSSVCANAVCHGTDLTGVAGSGPSCTSCHSYTPSI